jgi:hypothetical protein
VRLNQVLVVLEPQSRDVRMLATSQLERLISMTAISMPSGSRAARDPAQVVQLLHGVLGSHQ